MKAVRIKNSILLSLATFAVLSLGLFLPTIISTLQSGGAADQPRWFAVETIQLDAAKPAQVLDLLALMSGDPRAMVIEVGNVLSAEDASNAALDVLEFMTEYGLNFDLQSYTVHSQTPLLIFTRGGEEAAVLWQCELADLDSRSEITMYLDDETGKMIAFRYAGGTLPQQSVTRTELITENSLAEIWAEMCAEYYGFESADAGASICEDAAQKYDLTFMHSDGESLVLPFSIKYITNTVRSESISTAETLRTIIRFNGNALS